MALGEQGCPTFFDESRPCIMQPRRISRPTWAVASKVFTSMLHTGHSLRDGIIEHCAGGEEIVRMSYPWSEDQSCWMLMRGGHRPLSKSESFLVRLLKECQAYQPLTIRLKFKPRMVRGYFLQGCILIRMIIAARLSEECWSKLCL